MLCIFLGLKMVLRTWTGGASDYKFGRRVNILLKEAQGEAAESSDNCDNTTV